MKIAIHYRKKSYSDTWIKFCNLHNIEYILVNCFEENIMNLIKDYDIFLWHFHEADWKENQFARNILYSIEQRGILVYPNFKTSWHYDNKVAQKYIFEAIEAPVVPSFVFYDKETALDWIYKTKFPLVFKLSGGSGSSNVKLVSSKS